MMTFALTLLGTNSAFPSPQRFATAQLLQVQHWYFLFDCGEGTQIRLQQFELPAHRIHHIFISHLHGDHMLGLAGLLQSFALQQRKRVLHIYSPPGLEAIMQAHTAHASLVLPYPCVFHELDPGQHSLIYENGVLEVFSLPLNHRIPTCGFLVREKKRLRNMRSEYIERYSLTPEHIQSLKRGKDVRLSDGRWLRSAEVTSAPEPSRSFAFCTDTSFHPPLISRIRGVDLLYHEATFCEDLAQRALETGHSTARQAATIAGQAEAKHLILGHFSSRYADLDCFAEEASTVFPSVTLGEDGMRIQLPWRSDEKIRITYPDPG